LKHFKGKISKLLVLYIVLFSSVVTLILTAIQLWIDYNQGINNLNQRINQIKLTNTASITQSLWTIDNSSIQLHLDGLARIDDVIFVKITNESKKVIASSGKLRKENIITKHIALKKYYRGNVTTLGTLTVVATKENIYQQLIDTVVVILISQAIKTFLVSLFVLILFYYLVTRHLEKISRHSDEIEFEKEITPLSLDRKTNSFTENDELERVIESINNMSSNAYSTYKSLIENQKQLTEREAKFSVIFDSLSDAVVLTDNERKIVQVNPAFHTLFGYTENELINQTTSMLYAHPEEYSDQGKKRYNTEIKEPLSVYEIDYRRKDKTTFPSETMGGAIRLPDDTQIGFIGIIRDITERKRIEAETIDLQKQVQQAHKMEAIGRLTGGIAHDFNNILSSILGYAELSKDLLHESNDSKLVKYIDRINTAGERARDLVSQLLAFSRSAPSNPRPINLDHLIDDVISLVTPTIPSSIELTKEVSSNVPMVFMDDTQIHQILMNLCINARDAIQGQGRLVFKLKLESITDAICSSCNETIHGEYVKLTVEDSGTGIPQDILEKIFDPFITTKGVGKGTGMGLSVVHGILHKHNSHILVETSFNSGTRFHLLIPPITGETPDYPLKTNNNIELPANGNNKRILVIDDEPAVADFMQDFLQSHDYIVSVFTSSKLALEQFRKSPSAYDLVITDQTMPEMNGDQLIKEMLSINPEIPVILCSGYSDEIDERKALEMGCAQFLNKPIGNSTLLHAIHDVLTQQ